MLRKLLNHIESIGLSRLSGGKNIIAFSGGVDSSLVAKLLHITFPENSIAVLGVSPSLSSYQRELAHRVIKSIGGMPLIEVTTNEGSKDEYIANNGNACFVCKSQLYSTLNQIDDYLTKEVLVNNSKILLFNGTNKDDTYDSTRVGLGNLYLFIFVLIKNIIILQFYHNTIFLVIRIIYKRI